jgi:hypothetical protein
MDTRLTYEVVAAKRTDLGRRAESSRFAARARRFRSRKARSVGPIAVTVRLLELRAAQPAREGGQAVAPVRTLASRPPPGRATAAEG